MFPIGGSFIAEVYVGRAILDQSSLKSSSQTGSPMSCFHHQLFY